LSGLHLVAEQLSLAPLYTENKIHTNVTDVMLKGYSPSISNSTEQRDRRRMTFHIDLEMAIPN